MKCDRDHDCVGMGVVVSRERKFLATCDSTSHGSWRADSHGVGKERSVVGPQQTPVE